MTRSSAYLPMLADATVLTAAGGPVGSGVDLTARTIARRQLVQCDSRNAERVAGRNARPGARRHGAIRAGAIPAAPRTRLGNSQLQLQLVALINRESRFFGFHCSIPDGYMRRSGRLNWVTLSRPWSSGGSDESQGPGSQLDDFGHLPRTAVADTVRAHEHEQPQSDFLPLTLSRLRELLVRFSGALAGAMRALERSNSTAQAELAKLQRRHAVGIEWRLRD